ncbi:carbon-nitrogen hydrolase family protein [Streptomyces sp. OE57]|uniref:carbon-nitrogen hydrolase family protein n=1 Tax=Streptomyces lacaronensis TaxID=3379885 RepID=UPI0039B77998
MKLAMAQVDSTDDKQDNLEKIRRMTANAASAGAELIVFPEFAMYKHAQVGPWYGEAAEPLDGPFCTALAEIAKEHGRHLVAGMLESVPGESRAYNTVVVMDPSGELVTQYRKLHLYDAFGTRESDIIRPGDDLEPVTFLVNGVNVGVMTCYDLRFPEIARALADAGSELTLLPAAWTPGSRKEDHLQVLTRARAIENTYFLASVCQAPPLSTGGSLLVDPMGIVVGELGEVPAVGVYDIDPQRVAQVRVKNPSLANRRFTFSGMSPQEPTGVRASHQVAAR